MIEGKITAGEICTLLNRFRRDDPVMVEVLCERGRRLKIERIVAYEDPVYELPVITIRLDKEEEVKVG